MNLKSNKAITLVALIITIIILLILAGVTLSMVLGDNGLINKAQSSVDKYQERATNEQILLNSIEEYIYSKGQSATELTLSATSGTYTVGTAGSFTVTGNTSGGTLSVSSSAPNIADASVSGNTVTVTPKAVGTAIITVTSAATANHTEKTATYTATVVTPVSVGDIFDATGTVEGKLHVGDFIGNYSAGNWDGTNGTEYKKLSNTGGTAPNNSTDLPSSNFQFGGFTSTASRDGNATPYSTSYAYVTDKSTGQAVTGWRVFDVTDGKITLISAGCPEDYKHRAGSNYAYISEYILTGNINSSANASSLGLGTTYKPRDWSMYLSSEYKTTGSATVLTKAKLRAWYTKYMGVADGNTWATGEFETIYGTKYESLIDNYSYYWWVYDYRGTAMYYFDPDHVGGDYGDRACGVRLLVTLPSSVKISGTSAGTKTVTSRGADYTYNVWNIE